MSPSTALARGRALAQSLMVDSCVITRVTSKSTDDLTAAVTATTSTIYTGQCRVQDRSTVGMGRRVEVGEVSEILVRFVLQLPVIGSESVDRGDIVTITACQLDTALVGRVFRVHDIAHKTHASARRLGIEEVT